MIITEKITQLTLGERIRAYRTAQGFTQAQLAQLAEIQQAEISRIEADAYPRRGIGAKRLQRLANALGVTSSHLLGEVPFLAEWPTGK